MDCQFWVTPTFAPDRNHLRLAPFAEIPRAGTGPLDERKYLDPNGVTFNITTAAHARNTWQLAV